MRERGREREEGREGGREEMMEESREEWRAKRRIGGQLGLDSEAFSRPLFSLLPPSLSLPSSSSPLRSETETNGRVKEGRK